MKRKFDSSVCDSKYFEIFSSLTENFPTSWVNSFVKDIERNVTEENYDAAWMACIEGFRAGQASWEDCEDDCDSMDSFIDSSVQEFLDEFISKQ